MDIFNKMPSELYFINLNRVEIELEVLLITLFMKPSESN